MDPEGVFLALSLVLPRWWPEKELWKYAGSIYWQIILQYLMPMSPVVLVSQWICSYFENLCFDPNRKFSVSFGEIIVTLKGDHCMWKPQKKHSVRQRQIYLISLLYKVYVWTNELSWIGVKDWHLNWRSHTTLGVSYPFGVLCVLSQISMMRPQSSVVLSSLVAFSAIHE